jgi:hypothetical protein
MTLQPGCRFVVAPHFHLPADWPRRLLLGAGVAEDEGRFVPVDSWRPPSPEELALLVPAPDGKTSPEELEACVCLFGLPGHLLASWWDLLEWAAGELDACRLPGFERFLGQVTEFLAFKGLPAPEGARCDVVVSKPGRRSPLWVPGTDHAAGLPRPGPQEDLWARSWCGINLGDEETSVVLINLQGPQLRAELCRRLPGQRPSPAAGELAGQFLRYCSDYPTVRLLLGPGEGYRLPQGGLIAGGHRGDKQGPDVMLVISQEEGHPA